MAETLNVFRTLAFGIGLGYGLYWEFNRKPYQEPLRIRLKRFSAEAYDNYLEGRRKENDLAKAIAAGIDPKQSEKIMAEISKTIGVDLTKGDDHHHGHHHSAGFDPTRSYHEH